MEQELHGNEAELAGAIYARLEKALWAMGKNPPDRYSPAARRFITAEIRHLIRDKGYKFERAVAAAHEMARRKGLRVPRWRSNPTLAIANPPRRRLMGDAVYQIKYRHASNGKDWVHDFERPDDVRLEILDDHRVCMVSSGGALIGMR
jgi:hypothetical protein